MSNNPWNYVNSGAASNYAYAQALAARQEQAEANRRAAAAAEGRRRNAETAAAEARRKANAAAEGRQLASIAERRRVEPDHATPSSHPANDDGETRHPRATSMPDAPPMSRRDGSATPLATVALVAAGVGAWATWRARRKHRNELDAQAGEQAEKNESARDAGEEEAEAAT